MEKNKKIPYLCFNNTSLYFLTFVEMKYTLSVLLNLNRNTLI